MEVSHTYCLCFLKAVNWVRRGFGLDGLSLVSLDGQ